MCRYWRTYRAYLIKEAEDEGNSMNRLQKFIDLEQDARKFCFDWPNQVRLLDQIINECREGARED